MNKLNPTVIVDKVIVSKNITVNVFRDDLLIGGTKQRAIDILIDENPEYVTEFVYAGPVFGYAQVALAYVASIKNKQATIFVAKQKDGMQPLTIKAKSYGAKIVEIPYPNTLKDVQNAAEKYANKSDNILLLPFGLNTETFISALESNLRKSIPSELLMPDGYPRRLWIACGSGTLLETFSRIWPKTEFMAVQVGKKIWPDQLGINPDGTKRFNAQLFIAPEKFWEKTKTLPPYPSVPTYDAKVWQFVKKYSQNGDYIWNVGG